MDIEHCTGYEKCSVNYQLDGTRRKLLRRKGILHVHACIGFVTYVFGVLIPILPCPHTVHPHLSQPFHSAFTPFFVCLPLFLSSLFLVAFCRQLWINYFHFQIRFVVKLRISSWYTHTKRPVLRRANQTRQDLTWWNCFVSSTWYTSLFSVTVCICHRRNQQSGLAVNTFKQLPESKWTSTCLIAKWPPTYKLLRFSFNGTSQGTSQCSGKNSAEFQKS